MVFAVNDGLSFPEIDDKSIDFVFSGWTMQHMPTKEVVIKNITEMARVLKPEGFYKIDPLLARHRSSIETVVTSVVSSKVVRFFAPYLGMNRIVLTPTWRGVRFTEKEISRVLSTNVLSVNSSLETDGWEHFHEKKVVRKWFYGKKRDIRA